MGSCSLLLLVAALMAGISMGEAQLSYDYYRQSCPNLETIMRKEMIAIFVADATAPAAFLRLLFHDCQVQVRSFLFATLVFSFPPFSNDKLKILNGSN